MFYAGNGVHGVIRVPGPAAAEVGFDSGGWAFGHLLLPFNAHQALIKSNQANQAAKHP